MNEVVLIFQFVLIIVMICVINNSSKPKVNKTSTYIDSKNKELDNLNKMRKIKLTEPLTEKSRPTSFDEVIGQEKGIKALKAALCGPNPQHVIIYGPPGVGKTAAARLVLEEAKKNKVSPFTATSSLLR